jgi:hypothetical protein
MVTIGSDVRRVEIGLISSGSITRRYTVCGTPGCKCHADPPQRHGPYYQWTAKENGMTVTRRLSASEATLYSEWIANDRQMRRLITQMRELAAKAGQLKIKEAATANHNKSTISLRYAEVWRHVVFLNRTELADPSAAIPTTGQSQGQTGSYPFCRRSSTALEQSCGTVEKRALRSCG